MRSDLLPLLICPSCRSGGLELAVTARDSREVRAGLLFCPRCAARYPIEEGVVDLLDNPPAEILREQQGWLKLLGATGPELDPQMLELPYLDHEHWWPQAANFDGLLEHIRLNGARVLDVGSGRTWSARLLLRHGAAQVVATDIARQKYLGLETADLFFESDGIYFERVLCDMETMPFASASFDAVFSTASLHHALDLRRTFMEFNRLLRPNGLVLLTNEPVRPYNFPMDMSESSEVAMGINEHIYTIEEWVEAAEVAGFTVRLYMSRSVERAYDEKRLDQALVVRPTFDYLPPLLGSAVGRRLLDWQPLLFNAYHDYGLPLIMVAHKEYDLIDARVRSTAAIDMGGSTPTSEGSKLPGHLLLTHPHNRRRPTAQGAMLHRSVRFITHVRASTRGFLAASRGWLMARYHNRPLSSSLPFNHAIKRYVLHGLYPIERAADGRPFCWTAPDTALTLRRPRQARTLRLRVALPPVPRRLTITISGVLVGHLCSESSETVGPWHDVTFELPSAIAHQPIINLQLDQPWSPAEVWGSDDTRALGIALTGIAYI